MGAFIAMLGDPPPRADAQGSGAQSVLGPGLYVFQTRVRSASCGDASRTGHVRSYVAEVHGVPHSAQMAMALPSSNYWGEWVLTVSDDRIEGDATNDVGTQHFELRRDGSRFTGTSRRNYRRGNARCVVELDALLKRIDD